MIIGENLTLEQKLEILGDAAKYDVACTSSGVDRKGNGQGIGNAVKGGICHAFAADGRCVSLLKILMTNECAYNCKYCINRSQNDVVRATFTPEEVARLTIEFYRRNYIEGLFLSSGIYPNPEETVRRMLEAIRLLRVKYRFNGYIHVKTIPGASMELTQEVGWLADRMSVNLELPTAEGLQKLAPNKNRSNILKPMRMIQNGIMLDKSVQQEKLGRIGITNNGMNTKAEPVLQVPGDRFSVHRMLPQESTERFFLQTRPEGSTGRFVPAGQSTQMIIGATGENDYQIMSVTQELYHKFDLKRVFYSSFINVNNDADMPQWTGRTILDREHRLYQADFLLRFYGFDVKDLLTPDRPNFNMLLDPKCDYALRHLDKFPIEVNRASYHMLLQVPGIGVTSARRIVAARRGGQLDFMDLSRMGVVMKRAVYFVTCSGKMMYHINMNENALMNYLVDDSKRFILTSEGVQYEQLSLFDFGIGKETNQPIISA